MKHLRRSTIALLIELGIFFNIERLDFGQANLIDIQSFVYVLGLVAVVVVIVLPAFHRSPIGWTLVTWGGLYLVVKLLLLGERQIVGGIHTYITITEATLVLATAALAHSVGRACHDFQQAVERITLANVGRRVRSLADATEEIEVEMIRSRRHRHPLSVVVVEPEPKSLAARLHRSVQEVQREMMDRYVLVSLAGMVSQTLRRTDIVLEQSERGRFIILSPETSAEGSAVLMDRVRAAAAEHLGVTVTCGAASFPDEAISFEELVGRADERIRGTAESAPPPAVQGRKGGRPERRAMTG